jgi:hypothetical protein
MNGPAAADAVQARMRQIRCEIDHDLEEMAASARKMVDWRHYVKTHPWVCLGAAAALGFLIVPRRSKGSAPDLAAVAALARTGHVVAEPAPAATRGLVDLLLSTVASIAVRKAIELLGQGAGRLWGMAADAPPRPPPVADGASDRAFRRG